MRVAEEAVCTGELRGGSAGSLSGPTALPCPTSFHRSERNAGRGAFEKQAKCPSVAFGRAGPQTLHCVLQCFSSSQYIRSFSFAKGNSKGVSQTHNRSALLAREWTVLSGEESRVYTE